MLEIIQKGINKKSVYWILLVSFLSLLLVDRAVALVHFGFVYTDIDQLVMWNGAVDYSMGVFHEPFFYGQPYNYMLEAMLAVPFLYLNVPVYIALPMATSIITLLPFITLAVLFTKKRKYFWACLCLAVPVLLPVQYNFLTSISRGFVQAYFFIPLLFIPFFNPESKKSVTFLFLASGLCFIANASSVLIIFPIVSYVYSFHVKSTSFYKKALWAVPFLLIDQAFKYYYKIHPEKNLHNLGGVRLDGQTFIDSFSNPQLFENLLPFTPSGGLLYLLIFVLLSVVAYAKGMKKETIFILSTVFIILVSFAIPKVQASYAIENAGVFFTSSRFYLSVPLLAIISLFMVLKRCALGMRSILLLLGVCGVTLVIKNNSIQATVDHTIDNTSFPIAKNQELLSRAQELVALSSIHDAGLIIHKMSPSWDWNNLYDSYALYPLTYKDMPEDERAISVNLSKDRRSWLYEKSELRERVLLVGFNGDDALLKEFEHDIIDNDHVLIQNNSMSTTELFQKLRK